MTNVPCWGAVEGLSGVVIALAMTTHIEDLVLDISTALAVQAEDFMLEALPLGFPMFGVVLGVSVVCPVDETKICGRLGLMSIDSFQMELLQTYIVERR